MCTSIYISYLTGKLTVRTFSSKTNCIDCTKAPNITKDTPRRALEPSAEAPSSASFPPDKIAVDPTINTLTTFQITPTHWKLCNLSPRTFCFIIATKMIPFNTVKYRTKTKILNFRNERFYSRNKKHTSSQRKKKERKSNSTHLIHEVIDKY